MSSCRKVCDRVDNGAAIVASAIITGIIGPLLTALVLLAVSNHRKLTTIETTVNGTHAKAVDALAASVEQSKALAVENATLTAENTNLNRKAAP